MRALWPTTYTADLAPYHHDYWKWVERCQPERSASGVFVWPRGFSKTTNGRRTPIKLATQGYKYVLYVQGTQAQADDSVQNIGLILEHPNIAKYYPSLSDRKVGKHGTSQGWRRSRVWTRSGLVVDAAGLDTAVRGLLLEDLRPDVIIFDDIDEKLDTLKTTEKKLKVIQNSIIPAGAPSRVIMFLQNIINPHGVVTRLANANPEYPAEFLMDRHISGPHPAIEGFEYETRRDANHKPHHYIIGGRSTWEDARPIPVLEAELNDIGPAAFIEEKQNEIGTSKGTLYKDYDFHVIPYPALTDLQDVQVWADIAVTETDKSDSQAISAAGRRPDGKVVTLYAWEGIEGTDALMRRVILKAIELKASTIGIETNQGGDLWRDQYNNVWKAMLEEELISAGTFKPRYEEVKATTATGGKRERWQAVKGMRDRGEVLDAEGTHDTRFKSLRRVPEFKPFDLADADAWSILKLASSPPKFRMFAV